MAGDISFATPFVDWRHRIPEYFTSSGMRLHKVCWLFEESMEERVSAG